MSNIWNNITLQPPPVNTFKTNKKTIDLNKLTSLLAEIIKVLNNQKLLHEEAAYLSRMIYRMDKKFRSDIGFRSTKKTNTALLHYLKCNLHLDVTNFLSIIPKEYESENTYFPTKQMLEYLLVKLQGFAKIMCRIVVCSITASSFYRERITRGHSWNVSLLALAVHSRIWNICKDLCLKSCNWYDNLFTYLEHLQVSGVPWLPKRYTLPDNLMLWLNEDGIMNSSENIHGQLSKFRTQTSSKTAFDLIDVSDDDDDVQFCCTYDANCYIVEKEEISSSVVSSPTLISGNNSALHSPTLNVSKRDKTLCSIKLNIDIGEAVSREVYVAEIDQKGKISNDSKNDKSLKKLKSTKRKHSIKRIKTSSDLEQFIQTEEQYRNDDNKNSLSKKLGLMQWHALKNIMETYIKKLSDTRKHVRMESTLKKVQVLWNNRINKKIV